MCEADGICVVFVRTVLCVGLYYLCVLLCECVCVPLSGQQTVAACVAFSHISQCAYWAYSGQSRLVTMLEAHAAYEVMPLCPLLVTCL